jgi:hypothetical protein
VLEAVATRSAAPHPGRVRSGERGRDKLLTVADPPVDLPDRLLALRNGGTA